MESTLQTIDPSTRRVTVELGADDLNGYVADAETALSRSLEIDGFRKGKAPPDIARKHLDESQLREEALRLAVERSLIQLINKENLDVLDQTDFKIEENTPDKLRYQVTLTLFPSVALGPYRGIQIKKDSFERMRAELLKKIIDTSKVVVPQLLIERQLDAMMERFDHELHERGLELGPYLAELKKTQDDIRNDWRARAEEQVNTSLVLHGIAKAEKMEGDVNKVFEFIESHAIITA